MGLGKGPRGGEMSRTEGRRSPSGIRFAQDVAAFRSNGWFLSRQLLPHEEVTAVAAAQLLAIFCVVFVLLL